MIDSPHITPGILGYKTLASYIGFHERIHAAAGESRSGINPAKVLYGVMRRFMVQGFTRGFINEAASCGIELRWGICTCCDMRLLELHEKPGFRV